MLIFCKFYFLFWNLASCKIVYKITLQSFYFVWNEWPRWIRQQAVHLIRPYSIALITVDSLVQSDFTIAFCKPRQLSRSAAAKLASSQDKLLHRASPGFKKLFWPPLSFCCSQQAGVCQATRSSETVSKKLPSSGLRFEYSAFWPSWARQHSTSWETMESW